MTKKQMLEWFDCFSKDKRVPKAVLETCAQIVSDNRKLIPIFRGGSKKRAK